MKFYCNGIDLYDAVLKVIKAVAVKSTNPIFEGIKMKAEEDLLTLTATDGELLIETTIPADVKIEGETVVPGKLFSDFLRKLSGEQIEINVDKGIMKLTYSDSEGVFQCFNSEDFVEPKNVDNFEWFELERKDLRDLINKTIFSISNDDTRPTLKGCLFEINENKVTVVAIDGFRMAMYKKPVNCSAEFSVIIPGKSLNEITKFLDDKNQKVKVNVQRNYILIEIDNTKILSKRLDGEFINYRNVIANNGYQTKITVSKSQLEDAIERASLMSRQEKNNAIKLNVFNNCLTIKSASNVGNIKENITCSMEGKDIDISVNAKYILECLRVISEEFVVINFISSIAPFTISSTTKEEYLYLILPMRSFE